MRTFRQKETVTREWTATDWLWKGLSTAGVCVTPPNSPLTLRINHEDQIEHLIPTAPDDLKKYVRAEVLKHRPLADNEFRYSGHSMIVQLRLHEGDLQRRYRHLTYNTQWSSFCRDVDNPGPCPDVNRDMYAFARAWRDKHLPRPDEKNEWVDYHIDRAAEEIREAVHRTMNQCIGQALGNVEFTIEVKIK